MAREVSSISQIKSNILRPALTSQYIVSIPTPSTSRVGAILQNLLSTDQEKLNLLCSDTTLPGSSLVTSKNDNDRTGVTNTHAYRRDFGQQVNMSFYVDAERYLPIKFFESWMAMISGTDVQGGDQRSQSYSYRFRYPDDYLAKQGLKITKFERDLYTEERRTNLLEDIVNVIAGTDFGTTDINRTGSRLEYEFFDAFPIAISSMPISYESSQLLKCTVSFSYTRYIINEISVGHVSKSSNVIMGPSGSAAANEFFQQNRDSLINDTRGRSFSNPRDIINRYGGSTRLQDAPPADSQGRTINPLTNSSSIA